MATTATLATALLDFIIRERDIAISDGNLAVAELDSATELANASGVLKGKIAILNSLAEIVTAELTK